MDAGAERRLEQKVRAWPSAPRAGVSRTRRREMEQTKSGLRVRAENLGVKP